MSGRGGQSVYHFQLKQGCSAPEDGSSLHLTHPRAADPVWGWAPRALVGSGLGSHTCTVCQQAGKWHQPCRAVPCQRSLPQGEPCPGGCPAMLPAPLPCSPRHELSSCCLLERSQPRPGRGAERGAFITPSDLISQYSPFLAANCSRAHLLSQMGTASTLGLAFRFPLMR